MSGLTPMMEQYLKIKEKYRDAILFFRLGDFYEMFFEDAEIAARVLDLALTARNKGGGEKAPMAGVPYHSADSYIARLINHGFKVAICEQLEDPAEADGLVERDVIRVITPGTVIENEILNDKDNNFLAAAVLYNNMIGFSYIDISTGEFYVTEIQQDLLEKLWDEIDRIQPKEIIVDDYIKGCRCFRNICESNKIYVNNSSINSIKNAAENIFEHFKVSSLAAIGLEDFDAAVLCTGEVLKFIKETQKRTLNNINKISLYNISDFMIVDSTTRRNLELTATIRDKKKTGSLLGVLDKTMTSMGGRLIKKWINQPLINKRQIDRRLDSIEELIKNFILLQAIRNCIDGIYDLERILSRVSYGTANARDLRALLYSLEKIPGLYENFKLLKSALFIQLKSEFDLLEDITELLGKSIIEEPPVSLKEGGLIKDGYSKKLDEIRETMRNGRKWISNLQKIERERTNISSLKVGFNKVFGYYIEVTKSNLSKVPADYTRKQTLANSERYITPELKEKEAQILSAEERVNELEYELFVDIRDKVGENLERIRKTVNIIAVMDVLTSLALTAIENNYCKPVINNNLSINIKEGRHPVVEKMMPGNFVPNDVILDYNLQRFIIITGPNMSGKSTYMRQVALIVLMAQMGSFVPATAATIGLVDRIFTRVGASDDLTTGQSTFMVEMNEVANIINNASKKSLIILDEVGRGTSTYDGLSIAWAVSEYISDLDKIGARSLFATHYHELTRLEEKIKGIKNYNVLVEEDDEGVHFLHKIVPGKASESYGIEVAKLAGLPEELIQNATLILKQLERSNNTIILSKSEEKKEGRDYLRENIKQNNANQLRLFENRKEKGPDPIVEKLLEKNILNFTPIDAMNFLYKLQEEARKNMR